MLCARRDGALLLGLPAPRAADARLSPVAKLLDWLTSSAAGRQDLELKKVSNAARCSARRHHIPADGFSCRGNTYNLHCMPHSL